MHVLTLSVCSVCKYIWPLMLQLLLDILRLDSCSELSLAWGKTMGFSHAWALGQKPVLSTWTCSSMEAINKPLSLGLKQLLQMQSHIQNVHPSLWPRDARGRVKWSWHVGVRENLNPSPPADCVEECLSLAQLHIYLSLCMMCVCVWYTLILSVKNYPNVWGHSRFFNGRPNVYLNRFCACPLVSMTNLVSVPSSTLAFAIIWSQSHQM